MFNFKSSGGRSGRPFFELLNFDRAEEYPIELWRAWVNLLSCLIAFWRRIAGFYSAYFLKLVLSSSEGLVILIVLWVLLGSQLELFRVFSSGLILGLGN